jgi:hypothetical protein
MGSCGGGGGGFEVVDVRLPRGFELGERGAVNVRGVNGVNGVRLCRGGPLRLQWVCECVCA